MHNSVVLYCLFVFFFKQKTAYEMRISDWSSDVCSSDLGESSMAVIEEHAARLRRRHYLRQATATNRWFDFTSGKVADFAKRYGEDFRLIINGSHGTDDAFLIPFKVARSTFTRDPLDTRGTLGGPVEGSHHTMVPST